MTRRTCTIGIVLLAFAGLARAQDKVAMKQNIAPGDYEVRMTVKTTGQTRTGGAASQPATEQITATTMTAALSIGAPDNDGVRKASLIYRRIAYGVTSGIVSARYDSDDANTASGPLASRMKPLVDVKISFETTADGNVQNVTGLEEVWDAMAKKNAAMATMAEQMKKEFGGEQLKQMMGSGLAGYLPADPVAVGDAWRSSVKMTAPTVGAVSMDGNCKLASIEKAAGGRQALIDIDSRGTLDKPVEKKVGQTVMTFQKMDLHQAGQVAFDLERNMISAAKTTGESSLEMTMSTPDGRKVNVSSKQTAVTDLAIMPAK
jgi:hypothetical protein